MKALRFLVWYCKKPLFPSLCCHSISFTLCIIHSSLPPHLLNGLHEKPFSVHSTVQPSQLTLWLGALSISSISKPWVLLALSAIILALINSLNTPNSRLCSYFTKSVSLFVFLLCVPCRSQGASSADLAKSTLSHFRTTNYIVWHHFLCSVNW